MSPHFSKILIVVLQYNNSSDTVKCLASLAQLDYPNYEVIVVDNGSNTSDLETVRNWISSRSQSLLSTFHFLLSDSNLGYAGGNNIGIKHALENGADYVLILNNDTIVKADLLTKLTTCDVDNVGLIAPVIDEGQQKIYGGEVRWLKPELSHQTQNSKLKTQNFFLTGAAMLVKRAVFEDIGFFDERYFLYFEDADFCMRARERGYKLAVAEDATIQHTVSASTSKLGSPLLLRYHYRNAHLFNLKNGPWWAILALPFWSILIILRQSIKILFLPKKRKLSIGILLGVLDFYRWRFGKIT